jgi:hypothetical protein
LSHPGPYFFEGSWSPDNTDVQKNVYNKTPSDILVPLYILFPFILGIQKGQQVIFRKKVVLSKIVPEKILK